jgi:hypothetical protein
MISREDGRVFIGEVEKWLKCNNGDKTIQVSWVVLFLCSDKK